MDTAAAGSGPSAILASDSEREQAITALQDAAAGGRLTLAEFAFGTVTVVVPDGVAVEVTGGGMFASQVIDPAAPPPPAGAPRLHIRAWGPGGTLYVRSS